MWIENGLELKAPGLNCLLIVIYVQSQPDPERGMLDELGIELNQ